MAEQIPLKWDDAANTPARFTSTDTIPIEHIATGTPDGTKFVRDDGTLAVPAGGGVGGGDVTGPASSTDNALPRFDGTSGKILQASSVIVSDANAITGVASIDVTGNVTVGGTVDGVDVAADAAALTAHVGAGGSVHANAVAAGAAGFMTGADKTKLDGIAAGAEVNTASNLTATSAHGGIGVYASKSASDLRLRPIVQSRQIIASNVGNDVRVAFDASRYRPSREAADRFKGYRVCGSWIAGAKAAAPTLHGPAWVGGVEADGVTGATVSVASGVYTRAAGGSITWLIEGFSPGNVLTIAGFANAGNNGTKTVATVSHTQMTVTDTTGMVNETGAIPTITSYTEHLYPFMVATCLDYEGFPHDRHQRLESSLASGSASETLGYAAGDFIAAGEFSRGAKLVYEGVGYCANTVNVDAFFEFVLEPNPTVAGAPVFAGSNRMRMLSGELGQTWSGNRPFKYRIELYAEGPTSYSYFGDFTIIGGDGLAAIRRECGGLVTGGFNWQTTDANLQLRWRVDRIANLNAYDATYQGLSTLRLAVNNYAVRGEGF